MEVSLSKQAGIFFTPKPSICSTLHGYIIAKHKGPVHKISVAQKRNITVKPIFTFMTPPSLASAIASCSWASFATIFFRIFFKFLLSLPSTRAVDAVEGEKRTKMQQQQLSKIC